MENNFPWIYQKIKGGVTIIGSGVSIGIIVGIILALNKEPEVAKYYLLIPIFFGLLIGLLITFRMKSKQGVDDLLQPDSEPAVYQKRYIDNTQDDDIISLLPTLTDYELIQLIAFRYPQMLKETKVIMKKELANRKITKSVFLDTFNTLETFRAKSEAYCPKCGFKRYNSNTEPGKVNCILCGYYHSIDNPNLFINKVKRAMGFYYDIGLSRFTIEEELY